MRFSDSHSRWPSFFMFGLGLFSLTKVYFIGCLAISEIFVFALGPILFLRNYSQMKRDGCLSFIWMTLILGVAAVASSVYNSTPFAYSIHAYAVIYGFMCFYVVYYVLLKKRMTSIGWYFLGAAISGIITIYAFNPQISISSTGGAFMGQADAEEILNGQLFLVQKLNSFIQVPVYGFYLKMPIVFSIVVPLAYVIFVALTTASGRSASLITLLGIGLIFLCGKSRRKMRQLNRKFGLLLGVSLVIVFSYKACYSYFASKGIFGWDALVKYEKQSRNGNDILSLLMAAFDRPFIGYGPLAEDKGGYVLKFFSKYGDEEDVENYMHHRKLMVMSGAREKLPTHSHIIGAWVHYGIWGLIYYGWILLILVAHLRKHVFAVPQWFGYFALAIPGMFWHVLFSPVSGRSGMGLMMAMIFIARAVGQGKIKLPYYMEVEAQKYE